MAGTLHIGRTASTLEGLRARDACDYLELDLLRGPHPKQKALDKLRESVRPGLELGLRIACAAEGLAQADLESTLAFARALQVRWIVVGSDRDLRPSATARTKLADAFQQLRGDGWQIAWQPQGLWDAVQAERFASDTGVERVVDPLEPGARLGPQNQYFRVSALSVRGSLRSSQVEQLAAQLSGSRDRYLVLPLRRVDVVARLLREHVTGSIPVEVDREADAP